MPGPRYARQFARAYAAYLEVAPEDIGGLLPPRNRPDAPAPDAEPPRSAGPDRLDAGPSKRRRRRPRATEAAADRLASAGDGQPPIEHAKGQPEPDRPWRLAFLGVLSLLAAAAIAGGFLYGLDEGSGDEPLLVGGALTSPTSTATLQPTATATDTLGATATPASTGPRIRRTPTPYAVVAPPEPVYEEPTIFFDPTPEPTEYIPPTEEPTEFPTEETPEPTPEAPTETEPPPPTETEEPPPTEEPTDETGSETPAAEGD